MPKDRTIEERVADWLMAYNAIESEFMREGGEALNALAGNANAADPTSIRVGIEAARIVFENRRTAAIVAESMTHYGLNRRDED